MRFPHLPRLVLPLALAPVLAMAGAAPTSAQWDAIPHDPTNPVLAGGSLLVHDNGSGVHAFSPVARKWTNIAPSGSIILGVGDWCTLVQDAAGFTAYSSRLNDSAFLPFNTPVFMAVEDDVCLVVDFIPGLGHRAHAYSAQYNAWVGTDFSATLALTDIAMSRFVIGVKDGTTLKGFGARTNGWTTTIASTPPTAIFADGNVVVCDATTEMEAFSGVLGGWATSPTVFPLDNLLVDHNVAYVRALDGVDFNGCGYSAYTGTWTTSPTVHPFGTTTEDISDNVVRIESTLVTQKFEAFGARPGNWAQIAGTYIPLALDEDYAVIEFNFRRLDAFSGLCGGTWVQETTCGPSIPLGTPDHIALLEEGPLHHTFRPGENLWEPPQLYFGAPPVNVADAVWDVRDIGGAFEAIPTRWPGPNVGALIPPVLFSTVGDGSYVAHQQLLGAGAGNVYLFDERCDQWPAPFNPGFGATLEADRNALVAHFGTTGAAPVWGYSVQRGDWTSPAAATPLSVTPTLDENVAWMVDGAGDLWGFGTPNENHVWFDWPNGTEYHVSGGNAPYLGLSVQGSPGDLAFVYVSAAKLNPGLVFPPVIGLLCIDPTFAVGLGPLGVIDADCLIEGRYPLPTLFPTCFQLWFQGLRFDPVTLVLEWAERCEPAWFF